MKHKCPVCRNIFNVNRSNHVYCTVECGNRAKKIRKRYDLSPDDVVKMYKKQNGRCAICGVKGDVFELGFNKRPTLAIDHDHRTGKVRELLCIECNLGIGKLKDCWKVVKNAFKYLKKHKP